MSFKRPVRGFLCLGRNQQNKVVAWIASTRNIAKSLAEDFIFREHGIRLTQMLSKPDGAGMIYPFTGRKITTPELWPTVTIIPLPQFALSDDENLLLVATLFADSSTHFAMYWFANLAGALAWVDERIKPHGGETTTDGYAYYHFFQDFMVGFTVPIHITLWSLTKNKLPPKEDTAPLN